MTARKLAAKRHNAWLLDFGQGQRAAAGTRTLLQILDSPALSAVPSTPFYCRSVVQWRGRMLPAMDMVARLGLPAAPCRYLAVVCYRQDHGTAPAYGALMLAAPPAPLAVEDGMACDLPEQDAAWRGLAISCIEHDGHAVPILNFSRIFAEPAPNPVDNG